MSYLIDTDWIIHGLHGKAKVVKELLRLRGEGLAISVISLAELYEGINRSVDPVSDERILKDFLTGVTVLRINEEICKTFGKQRARLRKEGRLIGDLDLLIASTCLYHNLVLLTDNIKEFERVEGLRLLKR